MDYNIIIAFAFAGALLQEIPLWQNMLVKLGIDFKPFNCSICFTFWSTIGYFIFTEGAFGIFSSIVAAVLAELINRQLNRT
jgi:hypothetical protein